jgi:hypothetical protein
MNSGTVISYDLAGGYGFIHPAEGGRDVCGLKSTIERAYLTVGNDWCDERTARRLLDEVAARYADLAEHLW